LFELEALQAVPAARRKELANGLEGMRLDTATAGASDINPVVEVAQKRFGASAAAFELS
jgi:hypothetical protein